MTANLLAQAKTLIAVPNPASPSGSDKLMILKAFEYSSTTCKSGALVKAPEGAGSQGLDEAVPRWQKDAAREAGSSALLFMKGAPEVIKGLVRPTSVPPDFDQVLLQRASVLEVTACSLAHAYEVDPTAMTWHFTQSMSHFLLNMTEALIELIN